MKFEPHCCTCACRPAMPSTFRSGVERLPYDLEREHTIVFSNGHVSTAPAMIHVTWLPAEYSSGFSRYRKYQTMLRLGQATNPREAVKMLAERRREWLEAETERTAPALRRKYTNRRPGYLRGLSRKMEMILAEGKPCAYCGDPNPRTVDHIFPRSRGVDHRRRNLVPACRPCNLQKGNRTPAEWEAAHRARGLPWPPAPQSRPEIDRRVTCKPISDAQKNALSAADEAGAAGSDLRQCSTVTVRSLLRRDWIAPVEQYSCIYVLTDKGRLAHEFGKVPR